MFLETAVPEWWQVLPVLLKVLSEIPDRSALYPVQAEKIQSAVLAMAVLLMVVLLRLVVQIYRMPAE